MASRGGPVKTRHHGEPERGPDRASREPSPAAPAAHVRRMSAAPAPAASAALPASLSGAMTSLGAAMGMTPASLIAAPGLARSGNRAAAFGDAVLVDPGRVPVSSSEQRGLLAHELAHVGQIRRGASAAPAAPAAVEREAHRVGEAARLGSSAVPAPVLAASSALLWGEFGPAHVDVGALAQITSQPAQPGAPVTTRTILEVRCNGDRFELHVTWDSSELIAAVRYVGADIASTTSGEWSLRVTPELAQGMAHSQPRRPQGDPTTAPRQTLAIAPGTGGPVDRDQFTFVDVPRVNQAGASHAVLSLGTDLPELILYDEIETDDTWTPALRRHSFTLHIAGEGPVRGRHRPFSIRSSNALPTPVAAELAEPMPDTLHESTASAQSLLDSASHELEAALADPDLGFAATLPGPVMNSMRGEIARRRGATTSGTADDPRTRQGAADLLLALSESTTRLRFLQALSDPGGYLGGAEVGQRAVARVAAVRGRIAAYVMVALDGDRARTSARRFEARAAFARLPFEIADLYLQEGGGLARLEQGHRDLAGDIERSRSHTHTGIRGIDALLGIVPDSNVAGTADDLRHHARQLRAALERGDPDVLSRLTTVTIDAQRQSGMLAIRAAHDQFTYFAQELDTWLDTVVGVFTDGSQENTARRYRDQFDRLLVSVERTGRLDPTAVDAAITSFNAIVTAPQFSHDVQSIQDRLRHIEVVRIVGRILAITAVAAIGGAMAGSLVGAGLSTAARAFALGSRGTFWLVEGGSLVAEAGAFTFISRTGEQALVGPSQRSAPTDFAINLATLGLLRTVGAVYGAWRPAFRATSPRLFAAGGVVSGAVSAHVFGELVHVLETGHAMSGGDRGIAVVQNLALVGILHLGRYFTQPLEARLTRSVSSLLGSDRVFRAEVARLEARRAAVVAESMEIAGRRDASPQEVARVLAESEAQFRAELALLRQAARFHSLPPAELQAAIGSHVRALASLELRFAQEGAPSPLAMDATFRSAAPGVVEYVADPATRAFLEAYHAERGGTLTIEGERLVGEIDGRRTHYVPRIESAGRAPARTEHAAALETSLGDLTGRVDVRENRALPGRSARVRTVGGRVVIEVGPRATADDVAAHLGEARIELQFSGPAGRLRALQERLVSLLRIRPGRGTRGGEATREVAKLRAMRDRLIELDRSIDRGARMTDEARSTERLADIVRQLAYYEGQLGSYERGRGYVAAFDTTGAAVTELRERFPRDEVTADGERVLFNGTLEISRARLQELDAVSGTSRASALEEIVDLSRVLRDAGGVEAQLPTAFQARLAALRETMPDVGTRPTAPPARGADPLLVAPDAPLAARADAATARVARLTSVASSIGDTALVTVLAPEVAATATRARAAQTAEERTAAATELAGHETSLAAIESRYRDAIDLRRAEDTRAAVERLANDVPGGDAARLDAAELARVQALRGEIETMRADRAAFDRTALDAILRELSGLEVRVDAQRATDLARGQRLAAAELADRQRAVADRGGDAASRERALGVDWLREIRDHYGAFVAEIDPSSGARRPGTTEAEAALQALETRATAAADAERTARASGDAEALTRAQAEHAAIALETAALKVRMRELAARALGAEVGLAPPTLHPALEALAPARLREVRAAIGDALFGVLVTHEAGTIRAVSEALARAASGADGATIAIDILTREVAARLRVDPAAVRDLAARLPPGEIAALANRLKATDLPPLGRLLVEAPAEFARVRDALRVSDPTNVVRNAVRDLLRHHTAGTITANALGEAATIIARLAQAFPVEIAGSVVAGAFAQGTRVTDLTTVRQRLGRLIPELLNFERMLAQTQVDVGGRIYRPEHALMNGDLHSPDWPESAARQRAADEGNPQGRFANYSEVRWAVEQAGRLGPGVTRAVIGGAGAGALPGTLPSWFRGEVFPVGGGPPIRPNSIYVMIRANGDVHTYPGVDLVVR
jgi:hypothetical protein